MTEDQVVAGEVLTSTDVTKADEDAAAEVVAAELAEAELATADVLAGIVGDEFGMEMISPWGDRWVWVKIDAELAQEIYKMLGQPVDYQQHAAADDAEAES